MADIPTDTVITTMADALATQSLIRLITWMSPAFPVGAFSYSGGLEQAVADGLVVDADGLRQWLMSWAEYGSGWNDAVLLAEAYRAFDDTQRLAEVRDLAEALAGSQERHMETMLQGEAFLTAAAHWPQPVLEQLGPRAAYPVAVGAIAGAHATGLEPALAAYLHGALSNLVSVAIRCGVMGQQGGVSILAALEPLISETAARAGASSLDDLGSATLVADIAALRHETMYSRLFRS